MPKTALKKEKWTLTFDPKLKSLIIREERKRGVYPVSLLEDLVRERFNPYGHTDVEDSVAYVREIRKASRDHSDEDFLEEIRAWRKRGS